MRYSLEPRDRIYVKGYRFMSFARSISNKYGQKLADTAKKTCYRCYKLASKRAIQKTAEATGDLVSNKIANKITSVSKKKSNNKNNDDDDAELTTHKKRHISPKERKQIFEELRLVPNSNV